MSVRPGLNPCGTILRGKCMDVHPFQGVGGAQPSLVRHRKGKTREALVTGRFKTSHRGRIKTGHPEVIYSYQKM